jgi:hypothetical protein
MFAGGAGGVGVVGLLLPPPHAVNDPITAAIVSDLIRASTLDLFPGGQSVWFSKRAILCESFAALRYLAPSMMLDRAIHLLKGGAGGWRASCCTGTAECRPTAGSATTGFPQS